MGLFTKYTRLDKSYLQVLNRSEMPFEVKKVLFINSADNASCRRGGHAHYKCHQILVCLSGEIEISLIDKDGVSTHFLTEGAELYHKNLEWADIEFKKNNSILLSLCSEEHDEKDYIKDKQEFERLITK